MANGHLKRAEELWEELKQSSQAERRRLFARMINHLMEFHLFDASARQSFFAGNSPMFPDFDTMTHAKLLSGTSIPVQQFLLIYAELDGHDQQPTDVCRFLRTAENAALIDDNISADHLVSE
jgi:hypothetical protein